MSGTRKSGAGKSPVGTVKHPGRGRPRRARTEVLAEKPLNAQETRIAYEPEPSVRKPKWIEVLEKELELEKSAVRKVDSAQKSRLLRINRELAENFWHLWLRFNSLDAMMTMQPDPQGFINFTVFPDEWRFKPDFDYSALDTIALVDTTQEQDRVGDSLIANYYTAGGECRFRLVFEFLEGEKYHRYAGWKRHIARHTLLDKPLESLTMPDIRKALGDVAKAWYGSYLKESRKVIVKFIRENYPQSETFMK